MLITFLVVVYKLHLIYMTFLIKLFEQFVVVKRIKNESTYELSTTC